MGRYAKPFDNSVLVDNLIGFSLFTRAQYFRFGCDQLEEVFVTADQKLAATRSTEFRNYYVTLRQEQVPVYRKADTGSEVVATTPAGLTKLFVDYAVPALDGTGRFWHVAHFAEGMDLWGYISEDMAGE